MQLGRRSNAGEAHGGDEDEAVARSFVVMAAGASVGAFAIAFQLGAFGAVFFEELHAVWVLSTVGLLSSFVLRVRVAPLWGRVVLGLPTVWLLLAFVDATRPDVVAEIVTEVAVVLTVVTLPYLAYVLVSIVSPGFLELPERRLQIGAVVIAVVIAGVGFFLGRINDRYLTCGDFVVSGNDEPVNCRSGDATTRVFDGR